MTRSLEPIDHFIDGAIPTRRDDRRIPLSDSLRGDPLGITGVRTLADFSTAAERLDSVGKTMGLLAAGGRIEYDEGILHSFQSLGAPYLGQVPLIAKSFLCGGKTAQSLRCE